MTKKIIDPQQGIIVTLFSHLIDFGNKWLTLGSWFFHSDKRIFFKLEMMMLVISLTCIGLLLTIHLFPSWLAITIAILLIQRILEFIIVYSRNFILSQGRIFSHFRNKQRQGQWLVLMFILNIIQIVLIFGIWYRLISILQPNAFSQSLDILNSLYFSIITFLTVGYGDIFPVTSLAKTLVMFQVILTFYIFLVVINGVISIHFKK